MSPSGDPRAEARRWLTLYRDLGVERIEAARAPAQRSQAATPRELSGPDAPALAALLAAAPDAATGLVQLREQVIGECRRCGLCQARTRIVFGVGSPRARLMFVGEGPGADEDARGEPFVGRAGQLLDRIIVAMGLTRAEVYIANIVKCRPPENRAPLPDESAHCSPFLFTQIALIRPELIVALGRTALEGLTGRAHDGITKERGRWFEHAGIPVIATFHPAYLLRNPAAKRPVWEDMQAVLQRLDLPVPES